MNLFGFGKKKEGGFMDVIRCDEQEYLVHKWSPSGSANTTQKENAIRYGSSVRVKDGELAVFVYRQKDGSMHDYLIGPFDQTIKTANFPILTSIVGTAFGGSSPFQAEIYFINLSGNIQIKFGIPYFDIYDPRFIDLGIRCAVRGTLTFNLTDYKNFIKLNRLINFDLNDFKDKIKDSCIQQVKSVVLNIPTEAQIPVMQIERKIDEISNIIQKKLSTYFVDDVGVNLKRVNISAIEFDKEHPNYKQLKEITADQQIKLEQAQINEKIKLGQAVTNVNITNLDETARIQRKEFEMQVEGRNFNVHQFNQQTSLLNNAVSNLGEMGSMGNGEGFNAAGLITSMMVGGAVGNRMGGMINEMPSPSSPPPPPVVVYYIALNGQQGGTHSLVQLQQLARTGQFTKNHHVWKEGMSNWDLAMNVPELLPVFAVVPPPLP